MLRRLRTISIWLIFLLGLAAVIIGFLGSKNVDTANSFSLQLTSIIGAALFGASLSLIIEQLLGTDVGDIRNYLLQKERFESAPDHLDAVSGEWYHYDLSKDGGKRIWQTLKFTLARGEMHNTLSGAFYQEGGSTQRRRRYTIEAGVRGGTLIAIMRAAEGEEHDQIQIVPNITRTHLNAVLGVQILETWDGDLCQSYVIYSRRQLVEGKDERVVGDNATKLDEILQELLKARGGLQDLRLLELQR
jgi:hypothetical protein